MPDLSLLEKAQRLRIYIGEADRWHGRPLYAALLEILKTRGMAGATVVRGVAGFGAQSRIHTAAILRLSEDLPLIVDVVDTPEKIGEALEVIYPMVREGLITLEDIRVIKYTHRYLNPLPADRLVGEVMTRDVVSLTPEQSVYSAWERMLETKLKSLPVVSERREVIGIVTDEDLLERAGIQQRLAIAVRAERGMIDAELSSLKDSPLKVQDVMSRPVVTAAEQEPLGLAAARMVKSGMKRLPVVNVHQQLVGMLSRLDILGQVARTAHAAPPASLPSGAIRTVQDVMVKQVPAVRQEADLPEIIDGMLKADSHRVIVVDPEGRAVGLISDSDVVSRIEPSHQRGVVQALRHLGEPPAAKATAFDLMSPGPLTAAPDLPVVEAARRMLEEGRKWLVVVDDSGRPLGLVDRRILLQALVSHYGG